MIIQKTVKLAMDVFEQKMEDVAGKPDGITERRTGVLIPFSISDRMQLSNVLRSP